MPRAAKTKRNRGKAAPAGIARKKRNWLRTIIFYLLFPLVVWLIAFLLWFNWHELTRIFTPAADNPKDAVKRASKIEPREKVDSNQPDQVQEKILDEDRRKLEDILKQRQ